jgi:hypothetical protein
MICITPLPIKAAAPTRPILSALAISDAPTPFAFSSAHLVGVDRSGPALVDAGCLGLGDALELALTAKVSFELRKDAEHIEEALAGGRRRQSIRTEYVKSGIRGNQQASRKAPSGKGN